MFNSSLFKKTSFLICFAVLFVSGVLAERPPSTLPPQSPISHPASMEERVRLLEKKVAILTDMFLKQQRLLPRLAAQPNAVRGADLDGEIPPPEQKKATPVSRSQLRSAWENSIEEMQRARFVPYFRDGESIGVRIFAIRSDSIVTKFGLKNGDILQSIDGVSVGNQPNRIFELLTAYGGKFERKIVLERKRRVLELVIPIKD